MRFATLFIVIRLSSPFQGTIHLTKDGKSVAFLPQKVNGESAKLMKDQVFRSENSSLGQSLGIPWETLRHPRVWANHTRGCCPNARKSEKTSMQSPFARFALEHTNTTLFNAKVAKNSDAKPLRALCVPSAFFALNLTVAVEAARRRLQPLFARVWARRCLHRLGETRLWRDVRRRRRTMPCKRDDNLSHCGNAISRM